MKNLCQSYGRDRETVTLLKRIQDSDMRLLDMYGVRE